MNNFLRSCRYDWPLHFVLLLTNWLPDNVIFLRFRGLLCRPFFASCGKNLRLGRRITFYNSSKIHLGSNIYIAQGNWFSAGDTITIGDEVLFGPKSVISSANHTQHNNSYRYGKHTEKPIKIGRGCWISASCTITAGTNIGEGTLITPNSVARGEIPPNVIYGSPKSTVFKSL